MQADRPRRLHVVAKGTEPRTVILGGQPIHDLIHKMTVEVGRPHETTVATIELFDVDGEFYGDADVKIDEKTAKLLESIGWTPPNVSAPDDTPLET